MSGEIVWGSWWRQTAYDWGAVPPRGSELDAGLYPDAFAFDSPSNQTTPTVTSPPPYLPAATTDIIHDPISNETPPLTFGFVFNKSARQHPHIFLWPSEREFIIQPLTKSGTPQALLATAGVGNYHTVDLLAWYTGHSKIKYVLRDTSHLSRSCHKPIFTTRTSRNWIRENTVASWPGKQSSALKVQLHSTTQISSAEMQKLYIILLNPAPEQISSW